MGIFAIRKEFVQHMELHEFGQSSLVAKAVSEWHGERKLIEDLIFKKKLHDYPGTGGKLWKNEAGLISYTFGNDGKIVKSFTIVYVRTIEEAQRLFKDVHDIDSTKLPAVPMHHKFAEREQSSTAKIKCPIYYV